MTPRVPPDAVPLETWDAGTNFYTPGWQERVDWAREHLGDAGRLYRAEFYLIDAPFAVLYRYAENEDGRKFMDPATKAPAVEEPIVLMLAGLPPERIRIGA
jgi:hypothetical protein